MQVDSTHQMSGVVRASTHRLCNISLCIHSLSAEGSSVDNDGSKTFPRRITASLARTRVLKKYDVIVNTK